MKRERGLAAVTAILVVAVAASAATLMLAQQSAMLDQTMLIASRAQADQYVRAGLDWCRGVLLEDGATSSFDSLDEGWAQPIAALPVERALVAGSITDEQGKLNLNNLVNAGQKSAPDVEAFQRLLVSLGLPPDLADAVVDWIDADGDLVSAGGAEDAYYLSLPRPYRAANVPMVQIEELYRVRGVDAKAVAKVKPHVTALGDRTRVNVNTATEAVIAALIPGSPDKVAQVVRARGARPLRSEAELAAIVGAEAAARFDVKSAYFSVRIQVAQDDVQLASEALVRRASAGQPGASPTAIIWRRSVY
jgi:general secretion pathway protein K